MKPIKLKIKTKTHEYPIIIGSNLIKNISSIIKNNSLEFRRCLLVVDTNISKTEISKIKESLYKIKCDNHTKDQIVNKILKIYETY